MAALYTGLFLFGMALVLLAVALDMLQPRLSKRESSDAR